MCHTTRPQGSSPFRYMYNLSMSVSITVFIHIMNIETLIINSFNSTTSDSVTDVTL